MRINASNINSAVFNVKSQNKINTTSQKKDEGVNVHAQKTEDSKKSNGGGLADTLKAIAERRQQITESKNELITKTLENGGKLTDIAEPLKMYEEQLKNLDKERQLAIAKEAEKNKAEKEVDKAGESQKVEKPKTEEELQAQKVNKTAEKIARFDTVVDSLSMAESMKARVKVLKSEMELDSSYRADFERSVAKTATGHTAALVDPDISSKEKEIEKLNKNIAELEKSAGKDLKNINEDVKEEAKRETIVKPTEDKNGDIKAETTQQEKSETAEEIDTYA